MRSHLCVLAVGLLLPSVVHAEAAPGDAMIEKHLAAEADRLSAKVFDGARTIDEWKEKRPRLVREYYDMLGLWPVPEKTPLQAKVTRVFESQGAVIENLHFQSRPGLYVTANLFRPKGAIGKLPTILYVCGHSGRGRDGGRTAFQDHGLWFANNGYNCLILDTLQLGEIPGIHHGTYGLRGTAAKEAPTRFWWHSAGYTPAGVECWNGVRGIDYLLTRPEVDPDRIGVTGISGGGAATFWIAAADDRVKVAVPVSGMSDLESYVKNKVINGHCDCMFLYNTYQWDWTTIAALVAPRPMLFANSDNDTIFPMDGNRRIIAKLRQLYAMYGKPELVDDYVSVGGHAYRPDLRVAVFRFLNKHLKGDTTSAVQDAKFDEIPGKELRAFPTDDDLPKDRINGKIDEVFAPRASVELPAKDGFGAWQTALLKKLHDTCFRRFPGRIPAATVADREVILDGKPSLRGVLVTEPGIEVDSFPTQKRGEIRNFFVMEEAAHDVFTKGRDLNPYWRPGNTWVISTRGHSGNTLWNAKSPPNYVQRAQALLGRNTNEGRIWDILAAYRYVVDKQLTHPLILGEGKGGILAVYAALLDPAIPEVIVVDPPTSHKQGAYMLGVLKVLDIPEALGLLAPRPLTIVGDDPAFDRTAEIYRLAGAADKLRRVSAKTR